MDDISRDVIVAMVTDVVATAGRPDWVDEPTQVRLVAALDIVDGRTRLETILDVLDETVTDKVARRFVDAHPHLVV